MKLTELKRFATRRAADDLVFILQGAGIPGVVEPVPGSGNGSGPLWAVMVPEEHLERGQRILQEETPDHRPLAPVVPLARRPRFHWTFGVVVVNLLVWIAMEGKGGSESRQVLLRFGASHAPSLPGQWWRTISATFLHIGLRHLLANMFSLVILGPAVMETWGVGRSYFMYLWSGVAGNWFSFALAPTAAVKAGASGCILGLLGMLAATKIRSIRSTRGPMPSRFKTWHIVAMLVAFYGFVIGTGQVDHLAHLGGLLAGGLLAGFLPLPGALAPRTGRWLGPALGGSSILVAATAGALVFVLG